MTEEQEQYIRDNCEPVDVDELYDDMLDECYGDIKIGGLTFSGRRIIEELDPTAYRCGKIDYLDSCELVEIDGDYYEQRYVDEALQDYEDEREWGG